MRYDYKRTMIEDIKSYIIWENIDVTELDDDKFYELENELFNDDSITGNASGSYTFNRVMARDYVLDNADLMVDAYKELSTIERMAEDIYNDDWETIDVTIRCYLIYETITTALDELNA